MAGSGISFHRTLTQRENREKHSRQPQDYLLWCLLGMFGAHRFMTSAPSWGLVYLATCWSGFSFAMTLVDDHCTAYERGDENGNIWL